LRIEEWIDHDLRNLLARAEDYKKKKKKKKVLGPGL